MDVQNKVHWALNASIEEIDKELDELKLAEVSLLNYKTIIYIVYNILYSLRPSRICLINYLKKRMLMTKFEV